MRNGIAARKAGWLNRTKTKGYISHYSGHMAQCSAANILVLFNILHTIISLRKDSRANGRRCSDAHRKLRIKPETNLCAVKSLFESKMKAFQPEQTHVEIRDVGALTTIKTLSSNAFIYEKNLKDFVLMLQGNCKRYLDGYQPWLIYFQGIAREGSRIIE